MRQGIEHEHSKPIRIIEYSLATRPSHAFVQQAYSFFWEHDDSGRQTFTPFARKLARSYNPYYASIPENPYRNPQDISWDFRGFGNPAVRAADQLAWILSALEGDISGKRILDLGSGSNGGTKDSEDPFDHDLYQPWLCRTLLELGAEPIGVDIGNLDGEKFKTYQIDVTHPHALDFLQDNSVDVVHSRALFTSPQMDMPEEQLMHTLRPQVQRVLAPDGAFVYSKGW